MLNETRLTVVWEGEYSTVQWCVKRMKIGGHLCEQQASEEHEYWNYSDYEACSVSQLVHLKK